MNPNIKKSVAALLVIAILGGMTACKKTTEPQEPERLNPSHWVNTLEPPLRASPYQVEVPEENRQKLAEAKAANADSTLWIEIPNTTINQVVVQTTDNEFYYRRNTQKVYDFAGCLYADFECDFGDGTKDDLPRNTIIYGHNLGNPMGITDDPNDVMFAQLFHFQDIEFAKANPYVYVSTENEDFVYQIFAVSYTEDKAKPVSYIHPNYNNEEYMKLINDMRDRSLYDYNVEVTTKDKILTLSTCTYKYGTYSVNNKQRFVVFAKLVTDKQFAETADLTENPDPKQPTFS
ncbi:MULTISPECIES: class B sortase [Oscillospiraceae]|uniref:Sortase B n=1 Tax=Harryflintia acetispora TaxID=1849041 RepID=A0A9X8Y882_9FIRM|nr:MULTISPECIES: class B sortase [Oscillospiraceae]TCL43444.1 sortase B [Harryflintia acetispora]